MWSVEPSQPVGLPDDRPLREIDLWAALARNVWNAAHGHSLMRRSVFKWERALACVVRGRTFASLQLRRNLGEPKMAWKAPIIAEVSVEMEINMYVCAARK